MPKLTFEQTLHALNTNSVTEIDLSDERLNEANDKFDALIKALEANKVAIKLNLSNCGITENNIVALMQALWANRALRFLDLSKNTITVAGVDYIKQLKPIEMVILGAIQSSNIQDIILPSVFVSSREPGFYYSRYHHLYKQYLEQNRKRHEESAKEIRRFYSYGRHIYHAYEDAKLETSKDESVNSTAKKDPAPMLRSSL